MDAVREGLQQEVNGFFVGPSIVEGEKGQLEKKLAPLEMYIAGVLHPINAPEEEMDDGDIDKGSGINENKEEENETKKMLRQNSIGLRVHLKNQVEKISIQVDYARYFTIDGEKWERRDFEKRDKEGKFEISLGNQSISDEIQIKNDENEPESKISWYYEKTGSYNVLSIFLENSSEWVESDTEEEKKRKEKSKEKIIDTDEAYRLNNINSIFQPKITVSAQEKIFEPISQEIHSFSDNEDIKFDLLYKNKKVYAIGYSCSADWIESDGVPDKISTSIIPHFLQNQVEKFSVNEGKDGKPASVDMYDLACFDDLEDDEKNRNTIKDRLSPLIKQYLEWVEQKEEESKSLNPLLQENIRKCRRACERMQEGLNILTNPTTPNGDKILRAFILTNRAMILQRLHFTYALNTSKGIKSGSMPDAKTIPKEEHPSWYPFQITFLLMTIQGLADKTHEDNETADLIWFPTGGGKTEAYLGVAAFTMILRRLKGGEVDGLGVSVIMRYTLRLLTLQQFERASTLICALEYLRRKVDPSLGKEPFLLGLWVGYSLTPNHHIQSKEVLEAYAENRGDIKNVLTPNGSPWQTSYCPWCGEKIKPRDYNYDSKSKWTLLKCPNSSGKCLFNDTGTRGLPLVTVDTDIYSRCPSMIIATVDKFARLPFRADIGNIFGRAGRHCNVHGFLKSRNDSTCTMDSSGKGKDGHFVKSLNGQNFPPDLFIQDELHLISGPLGTMVGLYETAVDYLCRKIIDGKETRPKVIASTATIRGAKEQILKIFNIKNTAEFPPAGIDRSDSFFWWESDKEGKMFTGLSFSRRSGKYALARAYAAMLQRINFIKKDMEDSSKTEEERTENLKKIIDPYWTLVGYYNSIRELGGAIRLVEDDVNSFLKFLTKTIYKKEDNTQIRNPGRPQSGIEELTGRNTQREINNIRDNLERYLPDDNVISILLATNMISVGVDIERLALMIVNGHPKSATEYIQATGRIGRRKNSPGAVFTLYNPYKPRDLSQYENFKGFHTMMQKYVEPSTLTPFSPRAYTRAVHAVLIAMIRLSIPALAEDEDAEKFRMSDGEKATKFILDRFESVQQIDKSTLSYEKFNEKLIAFQNEWVKFIKETDESVSNGELEKGVWYYNKWNPRDRQGLKNNPSVLMIEFSKAGETGRENFPVSTPESLREVEPQIKMKYIGSNVR